ncbi:MAG: carbonic anhydrase [Candidatus Binatia bacterium]|nr:MAG: carbonic anhydrase [Candidatus Binatia bacterium]
METPLERLREGNRRFLAGAARYHAPVSETERRALAKGQAPFAAVLGCADSRVVPEILFDCKAGELFVVRVAGNVAGPLEIASLEFAVESLGTRLVLVLGHTNCGAVASAFEARRTGAPPPSASLGVLLEKLEPALESASRAHARGDERAILREAERRSALESAARLARESALLERRLQEDLRIASAIVDLETGEVEFLAP